MNPKTQAKWIWYYGDYEIFHNALLHTRREYKEISYPSFWGLSTPAMKIHFIKEFTLCEKSTIKVFSNGDGMVEMNGTRYPLNKDFTLESGNYSAFISVFKMGGLPSIYINHPNLKTDDTWQASKTRRDYSRVGCVPNFVNENDNVEVFPFSYKKITPTSTTILKDGILFDFGNEYFGNIIIDNANKDETMIVCYGESKEEALDLEFAEIHETITGSNTYKLRQRAFRYIFVKTTNQNIRLTALYEYLPIADIASFSSDNPMTKRIFEICSHTFHLNSREFFLDGIKRDRWVWSGDTYQAFKFNNYLFFNEELTKRSILALLGNPPYLEHINNINDYSMYLIISILDFYNSSCDLEFLKIIYPKVKTLFEFITSRLDDNDLMVELHNDWVFIDWSEMDKSGPLCAEQIILWQTYNSMYQITKLCGAQNQTYLKTAEKLKETINSLFWNNKKGAFIDTFTSGKNNITRHANILAILYKFTSKSQTESIVKNVLENDNITQITTPYFKFYELCALCEVGKIEVAQNYINDYWGGMIQNGATTVWEQFDPTQKGVEHLEMYGAKYGRSLAHAWGCGPIYIFGNYISGVKATSPGYETFEVAPISGIYKKFTSTVPIKNGFVKIDFNGINYQILTNKDGGVFKLNGKTYPLEKDKELIV